MVTSARSENHEDEGWSGFPKTNPKSDYSKMKQNSSTEFWANLSNDIYNKNDPQTPPRPQIQIFSWIARIVYRKSFGNTFIEVWHSCESHGFSVR